MPELANVVWQWCRFREVPIVEGIEVLRDAECLLTNVVASNYLWESALELGIAASYPVYDTLFIALAVMTDSRMITCDQRLLTAFPEHTVSLDSRKL